MLNRPESNEYVPYYDRYISLVPAGSLLHLLEQQLLDTVGFLRSIPAADETFRCDEENRTIREVIGHISDVERIFAYRLLRAARGESRPIEGFDEDTFMAHAGFASRTLPDLIREFEAVRRATITLAASLTDDAWLRMGHSYGTPISARALGYVIAGHELYHMNPVRDAYRKA